MKQTVRYNVFETNSSSIHDLAICEEDQLEKELDAATYETDIWAEEEFGWGLEYITDPDKKLTYLYIFACSKLGYDGDTSYIAKLKNTFPNVRFHEYKTYKYPEINGYIDHESEKEELVDYALRNPDEFLNRAVIILENDNDNYEDPINKWLKKHKAKIVVCCGN